MDKTIYCRQCGKPNDPDSKFCGYCGAAVETNISTEPAPAQQDAQKPVNVVNEENFVTTTEYPMARETEKRVLPVEMEKLASMYEEGKGVARDYIKGAEWREELCAYREKQYDDSQTKEDAKKLIFALRDCGDAWLAAGKLDRAKSVYEKLAKVAEATDNQRYLSVSYDRMGEIACAQGKLEEAEIWYRKSLVIDEELAEETESAK